ncbi:MAG: N-acetyl-alpha-D-glucosaminyl L-malate synthase BshA, partial [Thermoanaerobaculia bacterium]
VCVNRSMRIGISCYPTFGGSGVVATELAMALAGGGDEVHVISYALPSRLSLLSPNLFFHEVVVPHYPLFEYPPYSLALASKMAEVARHQKLDLMHVHYAVPNAISAILAKQILAPLPLAVVTTLHGTDITLVGNDPSYLETTRFGLRSSDAVTSVSSSLRVATFDQLGLDVSRIEVIPNFIDPQRYEAVRGKAGARRWAKPGEKILIHISNFRPVKRIMDVLDVFFEVRKSVPARLLLVGDGPDRAKAEERCRRGGYCGSVTFLGNIAAVEEVLVGADLFLLPSESESFGLAALEALSCAVPVVASTAGGIPEVVRDGVDGLLFPVGAVHEMAKGAVGLLSDSDRHAQFAAAGREGAVERFAQARIVGQYRSLYERTLAGLAPTAAAADSRSPGSLASASVGGASAN